MTKKWSSRLTFFAFVVLMVGLGSNDSLRGIFSTIFQEHFSLTTTQLGLIVTASYIGNLVFLLVGGNLSTRFSKKRVLQVLILIWMAALALFAFTSNYTVLLIGMALGIMAAVVWASYGIAQKVLLRTISPGRIMRFIYLAGALALTPLSTPSAFLELDSLQTGCLIFACINTIIAYGAFSTAMKNWHAAKVSAVVTTTPPFTLGLEALGALALPQVFPLEHLGLLSLLGAVVVVLGAMGIALGPMLHLPHKRS